MMLQLLNKAFLAKTTVESFFLCCSEPFGTYILEPTCMWWQNIMNKQTYTSIANQTLLLERGYEDIYFLGVLSSSENQFIQQSILLNFTKSSICTTNNYLRGGEDQKLPQGGRLDITANGSWGERFRVDLPGHQGIQYVCTMAFNKNTTIENVSGRMI